MVEGCCGNNDIAAEQLGAMSAAAARITSSQYYYHLIHRVLVLPCSLASFQFPIANCSRSQVRPRYRRREEAPQVQARYRGSA